MKLTAILVEDEYKVREVFVNLLQKYCPEIEIVGQAENINEAYRLINLKKPNVVFLDIEMPGGSGFELLAMFEKQFFEVIFVTSYGHYAIRAIKFSALDYLLKPVIIEDLKQVVVRLKEQLDFKENALKYKLLQENLISSESDKKLVISSKTKIEYISISDIIYFKADGNYTTIYLTNSKKYYVARTLKEYEDILCQAQSSFIRIHKTFVINSSFIKHVERGKDCSVVLADDSILEVSRRKRQELMEKLNIN